MTDSSDRAVTEAEAIRKANADPRRKDGDLFVCQVDPADIGYGPPHFEVLTEAELIEDENCGQFYRAPVYCTGD